MVHNRGVKCGKVPSMVVHVWLATADVYRKIPMNDVYFRNLRRRTVEMHEHCALVTGYVEFSIWLLSRLRASQFSKHVKASRWSFRLCAAFGFCVRGFWLGAIYLFVFNGSRSTQLYPASQPDPYFWYNRRTSSGHVGLTHGSASVPWKPFTPHVYYNQGQAATVSCMHTE
jgi:hypothetical protein